MRRPQFPVEPWQRSAALRQDEGWRAGARRVSVVGAGISGRYEVVRGLLGVRVRGEDVPCFYGEGSVCLVVGRTELEVWRCHCLIGSRYWEPPVLPGVWNWPYVERFAESDGVLFVLDSQRDRRDANEHALALAMACLRQFERRVEEVPFVFLMNKRDLPCIEAEEDLRAYFRTPRCAHVPTVAPWGVGVGDALRALVALMETPR